MSSLSSGYMTLGRNGNETDPCPLRRVPVPRRHVVMISFIPLAPDLSNVVLLNYSVKCDDSPAFHNVVFPSRVWESQDRDSDLAAMYAVNSTHFTVIVPSSGCIRVMPCFKLFFTLFPVNEAPQKLSSGFWNCSVEHYSSFEHHMACNLETECEDGQDETEHCPFSSRDCQGLVALCDRCYKIVRRPRGIEENTADGNVCGGKYCSLFGGGLVYPKCAYDPYSILVNKSERLWDQMTSLWAGMYSLDQSLNNMYRYSVLSGRTVFFHQFSSIFRLKHDSSCVLLTLQDMIVYASDCAQHSRSIRGVICETRSNETEDNPDDTKRISLTNTIYPVSKEKHSMIVFSDGHLSYSFLVCGSVHINEIYNQEHESACYFTNPKSNLRRFHSHKLAILTPTFTCNEGFTFLSYTVVCDFTSDCLDSSDESFCKHPDCINTFTCTNGQCISYEDVCDYLSHCQDNSEENNCQEFKDRILVKERFPSPVLINFDNILQFIPEPMNSSESCPGSHYRCPGELNNCLPVYTRCNGMYDCTGHQDEEGCEEMTCPGFYQCRLSKTCLHSDHMCDGWPHCPMQDDELYCDVTCPVSCLCQGSTVLCRQGFRADLFPQIRFLDATGSGMTPSDVSSNVYLIDLVLVKCCLTTLPIMQLFNLRMLDLSENTLRHINMTSFTSLINMQSLSLSNNPITSMCTDPSSVARQSALTMLDLSHTTLSTFDFKALKQFSRLQKLNLTFTSIHTISSGGFQFLLQLTELYMDGSPVETFPSDIFKGLEYLQVISTDNYKFCCSEVLPRNFDHSSCFAPRDELLSCEDLLESWAYRGFLWLIALLSMTGNIFCFCARLFTKSMISASGFSVFVTNLAVADFLMGVYMAVIGVADELFRGRYLYHDATWKSSVTCKVAGFLSVLSSEVSALIICLITIDRFIVLCFPFSSIQFNRTSASIVSLLIWAVGWILASVPLLPVTSDWEFYSQTGVCIPLPVTRQEFKGKMYSFGIMIIFNFVLFLLISLGQAFIYWSILKNALKINTTKVSQDITIARRLITIALTDFMCWFPIGLCAILASTGIAIPGEVNVAFAIFVLPLNSALNPFMYTFNIWAEKRRKAEESALLKWMESHSDLILTEQTS